MGIEPKYGGWFGKSLAYNASHISLLGSYFYTMMYSIEQRYRETDWGGGCTYPGDQCWFPDLETR